MPIMEGLARVSKSWAHKAFSSWVKSSIQCSWKSVNVSPVIRVKQQSDMIYNFIMVARGHIVVARTVPC
ncbi:hypothetical protein D3C76_1217770 [compost metagenome]